MKDQNYISDDAAEDVAETRSKKGSNRRGKQHSAANEKSILQNTVNEQTYTSDDASTEDSTILKEIQPRPKTRKTTKKPADLKSIAPVLISEQTSMSEDTTEQSAEDSIAIKEAQSKRKTRKRGKKVSQSNDENHPLTQTKDHISDVATEDSAEDTIVVKEKEKGKKKKLEKVSQSNKNQISNEAENSKVLTETLAHMSEDITEDSAEESIVKEVQPKRGKRKQKKKTLQTNEKTLASKTEVTPTETNMQIPDDMIENSAEENIAVEESEGKKKMKQGKKAPTETNGPISDYETENSALEDIVVKKTISKRKRKQGKKISQSNEKLTSSILETTDEVNIQLVEEISQAEKVQGKKRRNKISVTEDQGTPRKKQRTESVLNSTFSIESEEESVKIPAASKIRKNSSGSWIESESISKVATELLTATKSKLIEPQPKPVEVIEPIESKNVKVNEPPIKNQVKFTGGPRSLNVTLNENKNVMLRTPAARKSVGIVNFNSVKKNVATPGTASKKPALPSRDQNSTSHIPKPTKAKAAPNFSEIHKKNFMKMQSVDEYIEKKLQARTASAVKSREKSVVDGAVTPRDQVKSRLFPTPASEKPIKINFVSGKLFSFFFRISSKKHSIDNIVLGLYKFLYGS